MHNLEESENGTQEYKSEVHSDPRQQQQKDREKQYNYFYPYTTPASQGCQQANGDTKVHSSNNNDIPLQNGAPLKTNNDHCQINAATEDAAA